MEGGADKDKADDHHVCSPFHYAEGSHEEVVRCLLEDGVHKNTVNHEQCTPLHLAAKGGHRQVARCLLADGADRDRVNCEKCTSMPGMAMWKFCLLEVGACKQ